MALIKCKECNKEISTTAFKCPNCGATPNNSRIVSAFFIFLLTLIILFFYYSTFG